MFAAFLTGDDARRATEVVHAVVAHGLRCALTGGLAIEAQLRTHGRPVELRRLNDIDFVVEGFASIPESLAGSFLQHHVHPDARDGRTLLQLIDEPRAIRIDLFCALGPPCRARAGWTMRPTASTCSPSKILLPERPHWSVEVSDGAARSMSSRRGRSPGCADLGGRSSWWPPGTIITSRSPGRSTRRHPTPCGYSTSAPIWWSSRHMLPTPRGADDVGTTGRSARRPQAESSRSSATARRVPAR